MQGSPRTARRPLVAVARSVRPGFVAPHRWDPPAERISPDNKCLKMASLDMTCTAPSYKYDTTVRSMHGTHVYYSVRHHAVPLELPQGCRWRCRGGRDLHLCTFFTLTYIFHLTSFYWMFLEGFYLFLQVGTLLYI